MQQLGDYNLMERIGAGGMGEVWLAENVHHKKRYALKLLPEELARDETFRHRFFDEARVMSELDHPGIVHVHHMGESHGRYYLVMDFIQGPEGRPCSLHERLAQAEHKRLEQVTVIEYVTQLCAALSYAHQQGVVHRDIKPANILIDEAGNTRITDFGLAKAVGPEFIQSQIHATMASLGDSPTILDPPRRAETDDTFDGSPTLAPGKSPSRRSSGSSGILGTSDYMSPEQREPGAKVDQRSDIYSLGVVIYRMLTGTRPVGLAKPPSRMAEGVSPFWDELVERCLEPDPSDRYQNAAELLDVLETEGRRWRGEAEVRSKQAEESGIRDRASVSEAEPEHGAADEARQRRRSKWVLTILLLAASIFVAVKVVQKRADLQLPAFTQDSSIDSADGDRVEQRPASTAEVVERETPITTPVVPSGSIRITAVSSVTDDDFLARQRAQVRIDGGRWRTVQLPFTEEGLSCEAHSVAVKIGGYGDLQQAQVAVEEGRTAQAGFAVTPEPGRMIVTCNASGAEVFDSAGKRLGPAGTSLTLQPFMSHRLTVRAAGHTAQDVTVRLLLPGQDSGPRNIVLDKLKEPTPGSPWRVADLGMAFVHVTPGTFQMGSEGGDPHEKPVHTVRISRGFWMGKTEVTNRAYQQFLLETHYDGRKEADSDYLRHRRDWSKYGSPEDGFPVTTVSWHNAVAFCQWLTERERKTSRLPEEHEYQLPTEAQWEYGARGGSLSRWYTYAGSNDIAEVAWYNANSQSRTQAVGQHQANELGLFDMSGNVWEWCRDWDGDYPSGSVTDPVGPRTGRRRALRGGAWHDDPGGCRSAFRFWDAPLRAGYGYGFRVVLAVSRD